MEGRECTGTEGQDCIVEDHECEVGVWTSLCKQKPVKKFQSKGMASSKWYFWKI